MMTIDEIQQRKRELQQQLQEYKDQNESLAGMMRMKIITMKSCLMQRDESLNNLAMRLHKTNDINALDEIANELSQFYSA